MCTRKGSQTSETYQDRWVLFYYLFFPKLYQDLKLGTRKQIQEIEELTALDRKLLAKKCRIRIKIKLSTNIFKWFLFFNLPKSQGHVQTFNKIKF